MVYYYDRASGQRLFAFEAFEHTPLRLALYLLTTPVLVHRACVCGSRLIPDDFPDITVITPGGPLRAGVDVAGAPRPLKGMGRRLLADQSTMPLPPGVRLPPAPPYKPWF